MSLATALQFVSRRFIYVLGDLLPSVACSRPLGTHGGGQELGPFAKRGSRVGLVDQLPRALGDEDQLAALSGSGDHHVEIHLWRMYQLVLWTSPRRQTHLQLWEH